MPMVVFMIPTSKTFTIKLKVSVFQHLLSKNICCRAAGTAKGIYYFGDSTKPSLKDHAWYKENSDGTTHPIAGAKAA